MVPTTVTAAALCKKDEVSGSEITLPVSTQLLKDKRFILFVSEKCTGGAMPSSSKPGDDESCGGGVQKNNPSSVNPAPELPKSLLEFERCITQLQVISGDRLSYSVLR